MPLQYRTMYMRRKATGENDKSNKCFICKLSVDLINFFINIYNQLLMESLEEI